MALMEAPKKGARVRMYRQGHGDCFLLAFRKKDGNPFYMLIDCGLWSKSEVDSKITIDKVIKSIEESTGGNLDVVLITHEHQDHVNGFGKKVKGKDCWEKFSVGEVWLAWTEDGSDKDANNLRRRFDDTLIGLAVALASPSMTAFVDDDRVQIIQEILELHTGGENVLSFAQNVAIGLRAGEPLAADIPGITNKMAMKKMRDMAGKVRFLDPEKGPYSLTGVDGVRIFALGPPRDADLLLSLDPSGDEEFKFRLDRSAISLLQAFSHDSDGDLSGRPFSPRYGVPISKLQGQSNGLSGFFRRYHGFEGDEGGGSQWRRISNDWLDAAEALAMRLNDEVNNTSLVIAIQLPETGKVLLFSGDAQRGNWISWKDLSWRIDRKKLTAKQLLSHTVLYKVGHHGSHNATLNGEIDDEHPNLSWFGIGEYADEFTAMIPANKKWAYKKKQVWKHPLKAIEDALLEKASGRVFRTDQGEGPQRPKGVSTRDWSTFKKRIVIEKLYFEFVVADE